MTKSRGSVDGCQGWGLASDLFEHVFDRHLGPGVAAWSEASLPGRRGRLDPGPGGQAPQGISSGGSRDIRDEWTSPSARAGASYMRRLRRESVQVASDATGAPQGFRWRRRRYRVRAVLAHWVEARIWWGEATGSSGQQQCWRVEATSPAGEVGVYDLVAVVVADTWRWRIDRVLD